jgi:basic membrane protein A
MWRWGVALLLVALVLTFLPAWKKRVVLGKSDHARARIGLVFDVGGRGDKSFNDAANVGLERAAKELDVETSYLEPTGSGDREAAMRRFAAEGYDLVIGVGFLFSSDVDAVAASSQR